MPADRPAELSGHFFLNVLSLVALLVVVVTWTVSTTDLFAEVGTLWAVSGLIFWLAFLLQMIPESRIRRVRGLFAERVLDDRRTWWFGFGTLGLFLFVTGFVGVLEIQNTSGPMLVRIDGDAGRVVGTNRPLRQFFWTNPLGIDRTLKVDRFPTREVTVRPWWLSGGSDSVVIPEAMLRHLILIAPGAAAAEEVKPGGGYRLRVIARDKDAEQVYVQQGEFYFGGLVWVGTDEPLPWPAEVARFQGWDRVMVKPNVTSQPAQVVVEVVDPTAEGTTGKIPRLRPGQQVTAQILNADERVVYESDLLIVPSSLTEQTFIQYLLIDKGPLLR